MSTSAVTGLGSCVAALAGFVVAQVPTTSEFGDIAKMGVSGSCLAVAGWLLVVTIPKILDTHQKTNDALRATMEKGFAELGAEMAKGNDRTAGLLQSTLTQLIQDRREGK